MKKWFPDEYVSSVRDIDFESLKARGIKGLILDIDNTLVPYYVPEPDKELTAFLLGLKEQGFSMYIVSNGKESRVSLFNRRLNFPYICKAGKPSEKGFQEAVRALALEPEAFAVIGDQIFTDIWGAHRMNMYGILVKQVSPRDEKITAVKRPLEKIIMYFYKRSLKEKKTDDR